MISGRPQSSVAASLINVWAYPPADGNDGQASAALASTLTFTTSLRSQDV